MKELSIISKRNDRDYGHFSRHLFQKFLLGTIIVVFLSSTSPVYAKKNDIIEQILQVIEKATTVYSQERNRNVSSAYNRYNPYIGFFDGTGLSKSSYLTVLNTATTSKVKASGDYINFLITILSKKGKAAVNVLDKDGSSIQQSLEASVDDDHRNDTDLLNISRSLEENYPRQVNGRTFADARAGSNATNLGQGSSAAGVESVAIGYKAQATGKFAITMGDQAQATGEDSLAIGRMAHALGKSSVALGSEYNDKSQHGDNDYTTAKTDYSTALGAVSKALGYGSTAVGHRAYATERDAISIGFYSKAPAERTIAIGANSKAEKKNSVAFGYEAVASSELSSAFGTQAKAKTMGSVALGDNSLADTASQVFGFNPLLKKDSTDTGSAWKSGRGAVSVGTSDKTRQITKVAAGKENTDAVNIAQLKSLQAYVDKGWKLSIGGANGKVVGIDGTVDFSTGDKNFQITKGESDNKVKFDLAKELTLNSVKLGTNTLDATGLMIQNGPQMTTVGINAGGKKITNVATGTEDNDAVNVAQLKASSSGSGSKDHLSDWSTDRVRIGVGQAHSTRGSVVIGKKYMSQGTHGEVFEDATVKADLGIAIGTRSLVEKGGDRGVAIGERAKVEVSGGIALGRNSTAKVKEGLFGYDPKTGTNSTSTNVEWKSKDGAFSIGGASSTRQIIGVAAGTQDSDAVNVAQLKALRGMITAQGSWNLSVDGAENTVIGSGETLELKTGSNNFKITSENKDKKVTFDLAKDITLKSIKLGEETLADDVGEAGTVTLDSTGLIITNGPKIVMDGIDAGNKKITNVAEGTENTDAVNYAQLKGLQDNVNKGWSLSVSDENAKTVLMGDRVDFSAASQNLQITKGESDNKVKFDLAKNITLESVKAGENILDKMGLIIKDGPQITTTGISAGSKKITGVKEGTENTDAVNFAQLQELKDAISSSTSKDDLAEWNEDKVRIGVPNNLVKTKGAVAIGRKVLGENTQDTFILSDYGIAIGSGARVQQQSNWAVSIGYNSKVSVSNGVALGALSVSDRAAFKKGYDPATGKTSQAESFNKIWSGNVGAFSVGVTNSVTRQIINVAAGSEDSDAVNVAQLKSLRESINPNWELSVNGENKTEVNSTNPVDLVAGSKNLDITKGQDDNKVKFDLATDITLESIKAGANTFDATGLIIKDGPKIMTVGIDAGSKKITGVSEGADDTDAVNFSQLKKIEKDVKEQVAASSFVKQNAETQHITIGKETDGDKIDIANKNGDKRTLTGIKDAALLAESNEAVTGAQLFATNNDVTTLKNNFSEIQTSVTGVQTNLSKIANNTSQYLGGDVDVLNGKAPTYTFEDKSYHDVASAFSGVSSSFTEVKQQITNVNNSITNVENQIKNVVSNSLVQQDGETQHITIGKETEGDKIDIANNENEKRTLTGIKAGVLSEDSNEAVTGLQLFETNKKVATYLGGGASYKDGEWSDPTFTVTTVKNNGESEEKTYQNVAEALSGVGSSITNVKNEISKEVNNTITTIKGDALSWSTDDQAFSAQHEKDDTKTNSKITHLLEGNITFDSTDAITGKQLYTLGDKIAQSFGGGARYGNGEWTAPTFTFKTVNGDGEEKEDTYQNVAEALSGVGRSITNVQKNITNQINSAITTIQGESLVQQDEATQHITIGKDAEGDKIDIANKSGEKRTLTGIKVGVLSAESNEAVIGSQLFATNNKVATYLGGGASYKDGKWSDPTFKVQTVDDHGNKKDEVYTDVAAAFAGIGTSITNVQNKVTNDITNKFSELNQNITNITQQVTGDALLWNDEAQAFVARHKKKAEEQGKATGAQENSKITFLLDGAVSKDSTDAITGKQLYSTNNTLATYLDKDAGYDEQGNWKAPSFQVKTVNSEGTTDEQSYTSVADAFAGVGTSFTNVQNKFTKEITNQINNAITNVQGDSLIKKDKETNLITIGKEVAGSEINIANNTNEARILSGVKAATKETEAVNLGQLKTVEKEVQEQVAANSFVKQDSNTKHITIGKDTGGDKIDIANNENEKRTLTGIKAGVLSADSNEAVTGLQLFETNKKVATYLGGGASYHDSKWSDPTFTVTTIKEGGEFEEKTYQNVAEALSGVGHSITNVKNEISKEVNNTITTVKGDSLLWSADDQAFSAQHEKDDAKTNSKITHLLDGNIASGSMDAVTGNQLYSLGNKVATYLGGNAHYENGTWTNPTFKVKTVNSEGTTEEQSYTSVAEAFEGVGTSFTNVQNKITKEINSAITTIQGESLIQQDKATQHITIGKDTEGDKIDIANKNKEKRTLTGIKNGALTEDSSEAVTGLQLFTTNNDVATLKKNFSEIQTSMTEVQTNLSTIATNTSQYLGGGTDILSGKAPTYTVEDKPYSDVASAFSGVSSSFTEVKKQITDVNNFITNVENQIKNVVSESLVKQDEDTQHITIGKGRGGDKIDIANTSDEQRTLTGIKDGVLAAESKEAVTGSQLFTTNQKVNSLSTNLQTVATNIAKSFGDNAKYEDGVWTAPTFTLKTVNGEGKEEDKTYQNVAEAFEGVGTSFTNFQNKITNQIKNAITNIQDESLIKKDKATNLINIGKEIEGSEINIANSKSELRTLSGVKEAMKADEAINKGQFDKGVKKLTEDLQFESSFAVHYDKKSNDNGVEADYTSITLGKEKGSVGLHNVANGLIDEKSHDAITGGQIYKIGADIAKFLGGGVAFNNGAFTGPTYKLSSVNGDGNITDKSFTDVGLAFAGIDSNIKNVNNNLTNKYKELTQNITNITQQVKGDALLWSDDEKAFVADHGEGNAKTNSKITHLLDGVISSSSQDAITGRQLHSMGSAFSVSLGGGASYEGGEWTAPNFKMKQFSENGKTEEENYSNVADALREVGNSFTNIHNEVNNEIARVRGESLVKQDDTTKYIHIGQETDGTIVNIANKDKEDRTLSGIKAATQENEAVNKAQFDKLDKKIETTSSFAVFYDKQSDDTVNHKSITLGGKDKEPVALHNVADGIVSSESHDAINGSQITKIFERIVKYFGGSASFKDGVFTGPIYKLLKIAENGTVAQEEHDNISSAFAGLDTNIKNINKRIKEVSEGIADDSLLWDKGEQAFVALHGEGNTRINSKITHLKNGDITADSSDAINGSQLYSLNEQLATYFGGGAGYQNGEWKAPNFKMKQFSEDGKTGEESYSNVADALREIGDSFTNIQNKITHEIAHVKGESLVKQDDQTQLITIGGEREGSIISIANNSGMVRSLSGVKGGLLAEGSTEAINGSQLYSVMDVLSSYFGGGAGYQNGEWKVPTFYVLQFKNDGNGDDKTGYDNVAGAFEGVNKSLSGINERIKNVTQNVSSNSLNWTEELGAYDARHKGQDSKIKHVADGEVSEGSKEAVNGGQLWQTNKKVEAVEERVENIDQHMKAIENTVTNDAVKYDKGIDGKKTNKVTLVGVSESDPVLIDNVADGRIASGSKEAINGGQLHDYTDQQMKIVLDDAKKYTDDRLNDVINNTVNNVVNETKSYTDIKFEALRYEVKEVRKESRQAAAIGLAVSNLSYEDTPGSLSLSIGTGVWRNQSAFAIGAGYMSENGKIRSNISATSSGGHWGIGAGLRVKLN
ncbi:Vomp family autotransporter [Bartonella raoultii]|uniref:Vomp family autotransporter n=1 Tax=Bartonella raoultii TaxID=1457020 RepID=UPI001ABAC371|nr:Vomp family autotransporter [Bartonella raoultii]